MTQAFRLEPPTRLLYYSGVRGTTARANLPRKSDPLFARVFTDKGIDIGAGADNLAQDGFYPGITSCESFDQEQGEDLYEQGFFPSRFNRNHLWTFTIFQRQGGSWSLRSINMTALIAKNLPEARILRIGLEDSGYNLGLKQVDQTTPACGAEAKIEVVLGKW